MKRSLFFVFPFFLFTFICFPLFADTADEAYQDAHECYVRLQGDAEAQKLRENWQKCIVKFEYVAKKFVRKDKGADAQFSLGRLYEELSANSKNRADWIKAIKEYQKYARQHPGDQMSDDAYFKAGVIYWERLKDKDNAKANLSKVVKFYKDGDMADEAAKYMKAIDAGVVPERPAAKNDVAPKVSARAVPTPLTVVIDPGHGGSDTGAMGSDGMPEKDLTLAISKRLVQQLKKKFSGARVFLTRDSDATLTLDDRVKFANTKKADYFISIHANASTSKEQSGVQTYYLNNASDEAAERLAKQENKSSPKKRSDLDKIIATMIQNASTEESSELAKMVHKRVVTNLSKRYSGINDQKVRSALFYVLVGVKCPSILVETSYITNPKEEKRLKDKTYQGVITASIADGLGDFVRSKKSLALNK